MTFAALVDRLSKSGRTITRIENGAALEHKYNSMYICVDEIGAFISKYDNEMVDGLSAFYDNIPYGKERVTGEVKIKIKSPLLNVLLGTTPQNLMDLMPEKAWGQGFTSRLIMVFSDERTIADDFNPDIVTKSDNLAHDLTIISNLYGQFLVTKEYAAAVLNWAQLGFLPVPAHPKLYHYASRRKTHLYKLSMISAIDRGNSLIVTVDDFNRAMGWLLSAEATMPDIFKAGVANADASAIEDILHFMKISDRDTGVGEQAITRFAQARVPLHSITRIVEILERSGQIYIVRCDRRTGFRYFRLSPDGLGAPSPVEDGAKNPPT